MNVTAFIRKTSAKDKATIYFRVRDEKCDIKCASELTINPNHWDAKRQSYKQRIALVKDSERQQLNDAILDLKRLISKEYYIGATAEWLKRVIFVFHHPNAYKLKDNQCQETRLSVLVEQYIQAKDFEKRQASVIRANIGKIERFEQYQKTVKKRTDYVMGIDNTTAEDLEDFYQFLVHEHEYVKLYPYLYRNAAKSVTQAVRSDNTLHSNFARLRTVFMWCIHRGITTNNPFLQFEMPKAVYGTPWYISIEERDCLYELDLSDNPHLATFRDMFVFQCFLGCRFGDLLNLKKENVIDGVVEYLPQKTKNHDGRTVRVPLTEKALAIYDRYKDRPTLSLFPHYNVADFNKAVRAVMELAHLDRKVPILNPQTRQNEMRPIYEVATSHAARRTFIGNLYKQVQDPNLISSMSGHANGSRAFARYRTIDDDIKRGLVDLIG